MSLRHPELLRKLTETPGVSGYEHLMTELVSSYLVKHTDKVFTDNLGNVVAVFEGEAQGPRVMLVSHIDEIGLIIRRIDSNGFIRVTRVGGIDARALISRDVRIVTDDGREVYGVVGVKSHHLLMSPEEKERVPSWNDIYIDVGAASYKEVRDLGVDVGCPVTYAPNYRFLNNRFVVTKTVDNRALNYVLLELAELIEGERLKPTVMLAFTVQEEFNQRGSIPIVRRFKPDVLVNTDIAVATDTPETLNEASPVVLGGGPVLYAYSFHGRGMLAGFIPHPKLRKFIEGVAREHSINIQRSVMLGAVTETAHLYLESEAGIPAVDIGLPCRYTHYPNEVAAVADVNSLIDLLMNALLNIHKAQH
ncbi:MAG: M20/M25/M40 family metallo-hydrolase [Sulfolobales archaeon]|nr:M20/M25/M40 family metallo-hydrolase [Sulfolobales archaeon]MCX8199231.1 M20/M25/M40 family metallo-hydrolase [Sulfolobales archaeon]MDW8170455.1 M20/M25/M40 family metallo-hydrolase [Desulfurococcaceae archaeon]